MRTRLEWPPHPKRRTTAVTARSEEEGSGTVGRNRRAVRIVHLTSVHPPDDVRIYVKECQTLAAAGFDVTLVAPGEPRPPSDGVRLVAVRRPGSRLRRVTRTAIAVYRAAVRRRADIYHFHDPELIPVGLLLKLGGSHVIYDVHEDVPRQILSKLWIRPTLRKPVAAMAAAVERVAACALDGIVTVTPAIAARFPAAKTVLVHNYPMLSEMARRPVQIPYRERPPVVVYIGSLTAERGAHELVRAMGLLNPRNDTRLILAVRVSPELEAALAAESGWDHVTATEWLSRAAVADLLGRARVGIVTFLPVPNHVSAYPTKLFEYMAAGLPVVASDFPVWREIVERAGCGVLVDPEDPAAIASAIDRLLADPVAAEAMGERGRSAVQDRFNWETEAKALVAFYGRLSDGG